MQVAMEAAQLAVSPSKIKKMYILVALEVSAASHASISPFCCCLFTALYLTPTPLHVHLL